MKQNFTWKYLGLISYQDALQKMEALREKRLRNEIPDHLLFLEHPPVVTMGRRNSSADLKIPVRELSKKGIQFIETDRGGKLTYHGPGQLVGYFIFNLEQKKLNIENFIHWVEEGIIALLQEYGIKGSRDPRNPGIWIGNKKIASLGFHVHRGVTTHGIALNVTNNLEPFSYFTPCGILNSGVTNLLELTKIELKIEMVAQRLAEHYYSHMDRLFINKSKIIC